MSSGANGEDQSLAAKAPVLAEFNSSEAMTEKLEQFADAQIITQAGELYDRKGEREGTAFLLSCHSNPISRLFSSGYLRYEFEHQREPR